MYSSYMKCSSRLAGYGQGLLANRKVGFIGEEIISKFTGDTPHL